MGDLVPTTEAAVERAEAEGAEHEGELPAGLAAYRGHADEAPRDRAPARVVSLDDARRVRRSSLVTHAAAALAGAAAVAAFWVATRKPENWQAGTDVPASASVSASAAEPTRIRIEAPTCGAGCCAGSDCPAARGELAACPSGRTCIDCDQDDIAEGAYRFRFGNFVPGDPWKKSLAAGPLEVCAKVGASALTCAPAFVGDAPADRWTDIPLVVTAGDTVGGVTLVIRFAGAKESLAEWSEPLPLNAAGLCKGFLIQPKFRTGDALGTLSVFLVDAHYVEVGRAADVPSLRRRRSTFVAPPGMPFRAFDTRAGGDDRFRLVLGPFGKAQAERIRWGILEAGGDASVGVGADHVGDGLLLE